MSGAFITFFGGNGCSWRTVLLGLALGLLVSGIGSSALNAATIEVRDRGTGCEYMSGEPITLPAASLSTNLFGPGAQMISNRMHTAQAPMFDVSGRITFPLTEYLGSGGAGGTNGVRPGEFPPYLIGLPYVWFLQNVRHYTNYECTVSVDVPATFFLLVDNRVNDYLRESPYDDPSFGPPDTQWVVEDGWQRVNTGLSPNGPFGPVGDYFGIDEGNNGTLNQAYSIYAKTLKQPGSVRLSTELDGNIYCLAIATNRTGLPQAGSPGTTLPKSGLQAITPKPSAP